MRQMLSYAKGYHKELLLGPFFKLLEAGFELIMPLLMAVLVDHIIPTRQTTDLIWWILGLVSLSVLGLIMAISAQYFSAKAAVGISSQLSRVLFARVINLPQSARDKLGTSSLLNRLTSDVLNLQNGINYFLRLFLRAPIIVLGSVVLAFTISARLAMFFVVMVLMLFALVYGLTKSLNPLYQTIRRQMDGLINLIREQLEGMRVIRAFNQTDSELEQFKEKNQLVTQQQMKSGVLAGFLSPLTFLIVNMTLLLLIWQGYWSVQFGQLSQGMVIALINYLLQILTELLKTTLLINYLGQAWTSSKRLVAVLETKIEDLDKPLPLQNNTELLLNVKGLSFTYPKAAQPALMNLDFQLCHGQNLGIIGGTGAGKTSLVKLLASLYPVTEGELTLFQDAHSPNNLSQWRSWVALVPQKAELFQGSIRANLTLGLQSAISEEEIWQALQVAQAETFVRERGLDSEISTGASLSGGQRQRLTIARAILTKKPLLILDNATSALDAITEQKVLQGLQTSFANGGLIVVSQRTRALENLDKILVLEAGRQVGFGSHKELLKTCPTYQEIAASQERRSDYDF